jgi:hypothetical protein
MFVETEGVPVSPHARHSVAGTEYGADAALGSFGSAGPGLLLLACNFRAVDEIENQFHQWTSVYNPPARAVKRIFPGRTGGGCEAAACLGCEEAFGPDGASRAAAGIFSRVLGN